MKEAKRKNNVPGRTYGGLTPEMRQATRRNKFLIAGLEVFGTLGFRKATVKGLCNEAGLTDRYFYESFSGLDKLLMAVYEQCMTKLRKRILHAIFDEYARTDANHAISVALETYFTELEDPRIARICMVEMEGISDEVNNLYYLYINNFAKLLIVLGNKAFPSWQISPKEKEMIGVSLIGALRQLATNWLISNYQADKKILVCAGSKLFFGTISLIEQ